MKALKDNELEMFKHILGLKDGALKHAMFEYLNKRYNTVVNTKEYVYAIGNIPIALVAHLDTVYVAPPKRIFHDQKQNIMWSPEGIGADDRAGVFAIIKLLRQGLRPHVILTTDEEIGALGAQALAKLPNPFPDLRYIIQLDRRGSNDCVFYGCNNQEFVKYIESFGFVEAYGTFTDISILCPSWGVAGVNLSIGYIDEHSIAETLYVNSMLYTIEKVGQMLKEKKDTIPHFEYIPYISSDYKMNWFCDICKDSFMLEELFPVKKINGETGFMCPDCLVNNAEWCEECNNPYQIDKNDKTNNKAHICPQCEESKNGFERARVTV